MKNSNLKSNLRYKVHNMFKFEIFNYFGALFFLFQILMTVFPLESTTCRRISPPSINQLFVLFHLMGVACHPFDPVINFWSCFCGKIEKSMKKWAKMLLFNMIHASYLRSDSKFELFRKFWFRKLSLYLTFTSGTAVKGMLKI